MSGQQSPVASERSKSEAVDESSREAKPYAREDGEQLWKDIQAQTGFDSYQDYLSHYGPDRSDFYQLRGWLLNAKSELELGLYDGYDCCYVVDVLANGDWSPKLSTRCRSTSGGELLAALRQPPEDVRVQILLWKIGNRISPELLEKLGLGLQIDPQFFLAVIEMLGVRGQWANRFRSSVDTRPLRSSHVVIHRVVATCVRRYPVDKPAAPPIILIAGDCNLTKNFMCVVDQNISKPPPFTLPKDPIQEDSSASPNRDWLDLYKETFSTLAENNPENFRRTAAIIAGVLMPLLHMNCLQIRMQCSRLRRIFLKLQTPTDTDNIDDQFVNRTSLNLYHERLWLRRSVEDSKDDISHFERYVSGEDANYLPDSSAYLNFKQETDQIHNEALRLETEVRDYLQLEVGNLSLEESRKSIELSNHQIQEGKRVKIFTILAFVYIPLNLATSIFGMNLQQLNQSGQNLWVFLVTGVTALLVTGVSWLCVEVITSYKGWPRYGSTEESRRNRGLAFRLALLVWLVKNGHTTWMWRSGAWLCILSNGKLGKFRAIAELDLDTRPTPRYVSKREEACNYVHKNIQSEQLWVNFELETVR